VNKGVVAPVHQIDLRNEIASRRREGVHEIVPAPAVQHHGEEKRRNPLCSIMAKKTAVAAR
jgi:hypothetical protein